MYIGDFPHTPFREGQVVVESHLPVWLLPLTCLILGGVEHSEAINGISCDAVGDLILYRKVTDDDKKRFPDLKDIIEVWITCDIPDHND